MPDFPQEFEWEVANLENTGFLWEHTSSPYIPYPGFQKPLGAIGEYNGKFMVNQYVLRGGNLYSPLGHIRKTYRNFFYPEDSWQYNGIRLVKKVMSQKILFTNQFARDVVRGLSKKHKEIPSKYFYDKNGSQIFTEIMKLPEYYLTNSETEIFNLHKESIVQRNQGKIIFIELGAGDASKTSILLEEFVRLDKILKYIPVDISNTAIMLLKNNISEELFKLDIEPLEIDFMKELPKIDFPNQKVIIAYLGSSLGNLSFQKSITLLKKINTILKIGDEVMIGLDLIKDLELIQTAYNDFSGVTSKFNLNILQRMNSELGANFKADQFFHHASYHPRESYA